MLNEKFVAAFIGYFIGGVWLVGWWLSEHPLPRHSRTNPNWTTKQRKQVYRRRVGIVVALLITGMMVIWTMDMRSDKNAELLSIRLTSRSDWLVPANDPMPDSNCKSKAPSDSLIVMFGNLTSWSRKFPHKLIEVSGIPRFVIDKNEQGAIAITTDVMDENNDAVVEVDKNQFTVSNTAFKVKRKDLSTLEVYIAHNKEEVLYVRYINPRVLKVRGVFWYGNWVMRATDTGVDIPGFMNDSGCSGGTEVDYMLGG